MGLFLPFGGVTPAVAPIEPLPAPVAKPAPAVVPADSDGDGVVDSLDKCPGTPVGVRVDGDGCPLDSDKDGVYDYLDKCPGTPIGVQVDGVGCPLDSDKDGVYDYLDKCPGTPIGVQVDGVGCPLDSDKDGVYDYQDKCPGTPIGVKVDKVGCPMPVAKLCSPTVLDVKFDTNKSDIKPQYRDELKKVGDFLIEFPNAKGVIEGHTDSVGSKPSNMKLSQRRADSVRGYIINTFKIAPERITAKGFGPTKPVADNKTAAGKQKNRRIEANFSCN
jgi:OOP family OmpA-OmpF porin